MKVIKRNGEIDVFDKEKVVDAILKAMKYGSGIVKEGIAESIAEEIYQEYKDNISMDAKEIDGLIYDKLIAKKQKHVARFYEGYRATREYQRKTNTIDNKVLGIINKKNKDLKDNSNKQIDLISTQRDLVAEEVSKDIALRMMLPSYIAQAHEEGLIYIHDLGHYLNPSINCCLINLKDMLENGTVINGKLITPPRSFQTACTVSTQIIAQVASGQFGGQTISLAHLAPFVRISKEKIHEEIKKEWDLLKFEYSEDELNQSMAKKLKKEIKAGIQTFQYQVNTLQTSNGRVLPLKNLVNFA